MAEDGKRVNPAAYLPFKTFLSSLDVLDHGIPNKLDRTIWKSQSGIVQGQIMMALRFFGLVTESDEPTPALYRLVGSPEKRREHIESLLRHAYRSIIDADLTKMTPKMLEKEMEQYNVSGDTRRKAIGFFLRAAKYADLSMHPLLIAQIRESSGQKRKRKPPTKSNGSVEGIATAPEDQSVRGSRRTLRLRGGGSVTLLIEADPFSLDTADREFLFELVDKIQGYRNDNPESEDNG